MNFMKIYSSFPSPSINIHKTKKIDFKFFCAFMMDAHHTLFMHKMRFVCLMAVVADADLTRAIRLACSARLEALRSQ